MATVYIPCAWLTGLEIGEAFTMNPMMVVGILLLLLFGLAMSLRHFGYRFYKKKTHRILDGMIIFLNVGMLFLVFGLLVIAVSMLDQLK